MEKREKCFALANYRDCIVPPAPANLCGSLCPEQVGQKQPLGNCVWTMATQWKGIWTFWALFSIFSVCFSGMAEVESDNFRGQNTPQGICEGMLDRHNKQKI